MTGIDHELDSFQIKINQLKEGVCFSCRLINYYEIQHIVKQKYCIISDLNKIIKKTCLEFSITSHYSIAKQDRILFIFKTQDNTLIRNFAQKLYSNSQFYINKKYPALYMQCCIASVIFPQINSKAIEIENILNMLLCSPTIAHYYREYSKAQHDVENIQKYNTELNFLRCALVDKKVCFAYQAVINHTTMKIHYHEALLRMPDTRGSYISVGPIIPIAEDTGLIFMIDQMVLEMAVKELVKDPELILGINISNIGTTDKALLSIAENLLSSHNVGNRLIIEITETSCNENYAQITLLMNKLRRFGCRFALDDFGAGFTSFRQLQNLSVDIIKIDAKYIRNITDDLYSQYFVKRLIKIAKNLGIEIIAEFVENAEIAQFLTNLKVNLLQGNFYSEAIFSRIKKMVISNKS